MWEEGGRRVVGSGSGAAFDMEVQISLSWTTIVPGTTLMQTNNSKHNTVFIYVTGLQASAGDSQLKFLLVYQSVSWDGVCLL